MAVVLSGSTNDITIGGVSVATDAEVSSAITDAVTTAGIALKTIASGTATFTATTNNINLTGIGIGVEIGDVIQISGADDAKNNSEFTIEVITDDNNIIVNQAHANRGTTKNVATRASDTGVTVKLLAKWYNAPIGLGRDNIGVTGNRAFGTTYSNNTRREIFIIMTAFSAGNANQNVAISAVVNGIAIAQSGSYITSAGGNNFATLSFTATRGCTYSVTLTGPNNTIIWSELR